MGSRKPCPGCGEIKPNRRADSCCHDCDSKLKSNEFYKKQYERAINGMSEVVLAWPGGSGNHHDAQKILNIFLDEFPKNSRGRTVVPEKFAEVFQRIRNKLSDLCNENYRLGHRNGADLLRGLAEGRMSINDFDFHKKAAEKLER